MSRRGSSGGEGAAPLPSGAAPNASRGASKPGHGAADLSRIDLEAIARQWISLWSAPVDWTLFDRLHADDFEDCSSAGRGTGKQDFAGGLAELVRVFPDLESKVDELVVDEATGRVAVRWSAMGTNRETFLGIGPTGRRTPFTGIEIIEIQDGVIVRRWGEWDISAHR